MVKPKKKPLNQFLKFSNIALQMGAMIGIGAFAGIKLDQYLGKNQLFTVTLSLLAVFGALYHIIKEVTRLSK